MNRPTTENPGGLVVTPPCPDCHSAEFVAPLDSAFVAWVCRDCGLKFKPRWPPAMTAKTVGIPKEELAAFEAQANEDISNDAAFGDDAPGFGRLRALADRGQKILRLIREVENLQSENERLEKENKRLHHDWTCAASAYSQLAASDTTKGNE